MSLVTQTMATEHNTIYLVNFENYLKPKPPARQVQQLQIPVQLIALSEEKSSLEMFCESSSMHGLSMIVLTKNTTKCEQIMWKLFIVLTVIMSGVAFLQSMAINAGTPTVTYIETTHEPAYRIPFPAVTLCSLNRYSKARGLKLAQKFALTMDQGISEILRLFQVPLYATENIHGTAEDFRKFDEMLSHNNYSLGRFYDELLTDCIQELLMCVWKGRAVPCDSLFDVVSAPSGRCCSFNYYAEKVQRSIKSIKSLAPKSARHVSGCGFQSGLIVLINPHSDDYMAGYLKSPGYRVIVHDAHDYPDDNSDIEFLSVRTTTYIAVKGEVTYGTKYLRNMDFLRRSCTFDPEHPLKYFREYSLWNCQAECLSSRVLVACGCIPYHMVHLPGQQMCNMTQADCVSQESEIFQKLVETPSILATEICGCMPDCSFNKYRTITSSSQLNKTFVRGAHRFFQNITITDQIHLHVFLADLTIPVYRMDPLDSWQSVVGTVGGITGLAMGFSCVSLCEAIFFICIRPLYVKLATQVKAKLVAARAH